MYSLGPDLVTFLSWKNFETSNKRDNKYLRVNRFCNVQCAFFREEHWTLYKVVSKKTILLNMTI